MSAARTQEPHRREEFYEAWSYKAPELVAHDIVTSQDKTAAITSRIPTALFEGVRSVVDFGCRYGGFVSEFAQRIGVERVVGVDYSPDAIKVAEKRFTASGLMSHGFLLRLTSLGRTSRLLRFAPYGPPTSATSVAWCSGLVEGCYFGF